MTMMISIALVLLMVLHMILTYRHKKVFDKRINGMNDMIDAIEKKHCGITIATPFVRDMDDSKRTKI